MKTSLFVKGLLLGKGFSISICFSHLDMVKCYYVVDVNCISVPTFVHSQFNFSD